MKVTKIQTQESEPTLKPQDLDIGEVFELIIINGDSSDVYLVVARRGEVNREYVCLTRNWIASKDYFESADKNLAVRRLSYSLNVWEKD